MKSTSTNALAREKREYQPPVLVAFLLLLMGTSVSLHQFKVPPLMDAIANELGFSAAAAPWLMSVFTLVCLVFAAPASLLIQRMRMKWVMLLSGAVVVAGSVLGAISPNGAFLLVSRSMEGFGFLLMSVAIPVAAAMYSTPSKIGLVMGICGVWISTGQILAFNTAPALFIHTGWRSVWWGYALFVVAALVILLFGFHSWDAAPSPRAAQAENIRLRDAVKNKNLLFPSVGFLVYNFSLMAVVTFFPGYATGSGLLSLRQASFVASLPMIFCLIGSPVLGRLTDRFGHKWLYALSLLCGGAGATLMFSKSVPLIVAGAAILGLIGAATPSLMFSSLGKLVPSMDWLAPSNGVAVLFQNAGMFLASLSFGYLVKAAGGNYTLSAMILLPLTAVSVILVFFTRYKEPEQEPKQAKESAL
ncbi:MAG: MFS transporter [Oscillospiraceae bacterium]|nr:MFS transporter [Oscillospiraceae bacterium]